MGFQRRLVPRKRFMRYKVRTVLENRRVCYMKHLAGEMTCELNCEISHAAHAFSLLLAGRALARVMKLTAGKSSHTTRRPATASRVNLDGGLLSSFLITPPLSVLESKFSCRKSLFRKQYCELYPSPESGCLSLLGAVHHELRYLEKPWRVLPSAWQ